MRLHDYLIANGFPNLAEGYSQQVYAQVDILKRLMAENNVQSILEIGFNGGHSSELFLSESPEHHVLSFDLGEHLYVAFGKKYIDETFPNRHTLVLGDSTVTIPNYCADTKYDLIFIDGGHSYEVALADLQNCKKFAHENTVVIMDDTVHIPMWEEPWTIGPTNAWKHGINSNLIVETDHADFRKGRGMSWGKYL